MEVKYRLLFVYSLMVVFCSMSFGADSHSNKNSLNTIASSEDSSQNAKDIKQVQVILKLKGETVKGNPKVVPAYNSAEALYRNKPLIELKEIEKNSWKCYLKNGERYVIGWLSDKMYGYQSEPFIASEGLVVDFSPGMPATFEYKINGTCEDIQAFPADVALLIKIIHEGKSNYLNWRHIEKIKKPDIVRIKGLAGGTYQISAQPENHNFKKPFLYDVRDITIKPGVVNQFESIYPEIDKTIEDGDVVIEGTIYDSNFKPVANKEVELRLDDLDHEFDLWYLPTKTDENGKYKFEGVRPSMDVQISCGDASGFVTKESLTKDAHIKMDLNTSKEKIKTKVNSAMPEICIKWKDKSQGKLSDLKGKIIVIDFWATWCGLCKRALPKFNILAEKDCWKKDVVFTAISIDDDGDIWKKTVETSGWNSIRHGWFDTAKNSFNLNKPIPYYMIIDKEGKIYSSGNGIDVEKKLNELLSN